MHNVAGKRPELMLNKVPEVTLAFWVIKVMSTTVGETGADYLAVHAGLGTGVTGIIMAGLLAVAFPTMLSLSCAGRLSLSNCLAVAGFLSLRTVRA